MGKVFAFCVAGAAFSLLAMCSINTAPPQGMARICDRQRCQVVSDAEALDHIIRCENAGMIAVIEGGGAVSCHMPSKP